MTDTRLLRSSAGSTIDAVPVLVDPESDRRLRDDGYVVVPLISEEVAATLLLEHERLRGSEGSGFEADLNNPDAEYRRTVAEVLRRHLGAAVTGLFVDFTPFLWNFLCKWPGDEEDLYIHRDWMFIDESEGARSYSVWIALQDVTGDNGQLRILPGSHLLAGELSGSELSPAWVEQLDVIEPRMVTVPVRVGEAVVMNHATVHGSFRNRTDQRRLAVGCALRPADSPLVHYREHAAGVAHRFDVDDSFFVTYTPAVLAAEPPGLPTAATVPFEPVPYSPATLAERLDAVGPRPTGLLRRLAGLVRASRRPATT